MASSTTTLISLASLSLLLVLVLNPSISAAQSDNILYSGEDLQTGDYLDLGIYTLIMQEDCNLVLYENEVDPIWASNTGWLAKNCYCSLQKDGNLVIYRPNGRPLWASNTNRGDGYYVLILQKDRNVVIYGGAIWATGTNSYSLNSKRHGAGSMDVVSIANLPSPIIYMDRTELAKNVTNGVTGHKTTGVTGRITAGVTGRITTRAGKVLA